MPFARHVDDLEPGSEVACVRQRHRVPEVLFVARVARVTKTQVVLDAGERFYRKNGRRVGPKTAAMRDDRLLPMTDAIRHREEFQRLVRDVRWWVGNTIHWDAFPIEKLRVLHAAVMDLRAETVRDAP